MTANEIFSLPFTQVTLPILVGFFIAAVSQTTGLISMLAAQDHVSSPQTETLQFDSSSCQLCGRALGRHRLRQLRHHGFTALAPSRSGGGRLQWEF